MSKKRKAKLSTQYCYLLAPVSDYIIPPSGRSFIKVGVTTNLSSRLTVFETHALHSARFIALSTLGEALETELKESLAPHVLKSRSKEWFLLPDEDLNEILETKEHEWVIDDAKIRDMVKTSNYMAKKKTITALHNSSEESKDQADEVEVEFKLPLSQAILIGAQNGGFIISAAKVANWLGQQPKNAIFRYMHFFKNGIDYRFVEKDEAAKIAAANGEC